MASLVCFHCFNVVSCDFHCLVLCKQTSYTTLSVIMQYILIHKKIWGVFLETQHCLFDLVLLFFSISITLVDALQNWLNCFHFLFLEGGLLVILIDCMIFLSLFLVVTRISMSTVSSLAQLGSGVFCLQNAFLWPII